MSRRRRSIADLVLQSWLDAEALAALRAIPVPRNADRTKRINTVILLAAATAGGQPWQGVFADARAATETTWYTEWQFIPEIVTALEICTAKALDMAVQELAHAETLALRKRQKAIAEGAVDAVQGLRITALSCTDRADHRNEASRLLLTVADDTLASRLGKAGARGVIEPASNAHTQLDDIGEVELDALIRNLIAATGFTGETVPQ